MKKGDESYKKQMLCMDPAGLKELLSANFLHDGHDFYSDSAEQVIRKHLQRYKGIGPATAEQIYMRAVNGTLL